ncbi:MAG TPA: 3-hydroxyacyl-CoA dehydrogenase NAD-binding domain-containing protein, partial [Thermoleophilaceae bacterium]
MTQPRTLGVVGAGTMGAGIAQLGCAAGMRTLLHDPQPTALDAGLERVRGGLAKWVEKGRADGRAGELLSPAATLEQLAGCELVIEAAPERLELKRELFAALSRVVGAEAVLASNTSSIPVTAIASAAARPQNVVGMHFFNPPPLMRLLELIRAEQTGQHALDVARAAGEAMGKDVILAVDGPGFLVNRCARPFAGEALRLLTERIASPEQIDRICRLGGGFKMGPFELMDLVGVDVNFDVAKSFAELSFGEPRWRPSPLQARLVAAGRLGRKTGRGWYEYRDGAHRPADPAPLGPGGGEGRVVLIEGRGRLAHELRERAVAAGFALRETAEPTGAQPELIVDATVHSTTRHATPVDTTADPAAAMLGIDPAATTDASRSTAGPEPTGAPTGGPLRVLLCADRPLAALGEPHAVGFHLLPPLAESRLVELTRLPSTPDASADAAERFFAALGFHAEWVGDAPGLVLGRIVCQLVNEGMFAVGEGVGSAADVDAGLTLGLAHPRGALAWGEAIGREHVLATIDGLWEERHEERYRA